MIGLELTLEGEKFLASVQNGVVTVIATVRVDDSKPTIELTFGGLGVYSDADREYISWVEKELQEGNEFHVKVKNIHQNSIPISTRKECDDEESDEDLLEQFYRIKEQLEKKGLL